MGAPQRPLSPSTSPPRAGTWGCPSSVSLPAVSPNPSARPLPSSGGVCSGRRGRAVPRLRCLWFGKFLLCFPLVSAGPLRGQCVRADQSRAGRQLLRGGTSSFSPCPGLPVSAGRSLSEEPAPLPCCCWLLWGGCEMPPVLLSSVATEMKTKPCQSPAPCCWPHPKSPTIPKRLPATTTLAPDPLQLLPPPRFCPLPAWGPRFFFLFFFLPLPPSPSIPLRLCNEAHCVCKVPGPLPGSGLRFVSAFKEGKRNRCRAEPGARPLLLPDHAAGSPTGDVWCLWHHMQAAILSQNTAITAAGWPSTAPCHPQGHENAGGAPVFPRDWPAWLQLSPGAVFAAHLRAAPASEREEERKGKGCPKRGQNKEGVER